MFLEKCFLFFFHEDCKNYTGGSCMNVAPNTAPYFCSTRNQPQIVLIKSILQIITEILKVSLVLYYKVNYNSCSVVSDKTKIKVKIQLFISRMNVDFVRASFLQQQSIDHFWYRLCISM